MLFRSLTSVLWLENVAPRDGTTMLIFNHGLIGDSVLSPEKVRVDFRRFAWLGSIAEDISACYMWHTKGPKNLAEVKAYGQINFGQTGAGSSSDIAQRILKNILGVKINEVHGYPGSAELRLAVERGEVDGSCGIVTYTYRQSWEASAKAGAFKILIQLGLEKAPVYGDAPNVYDYAKTPFQRDVLRLVFGQQMLGRPLLAPPGLMTDRRDALRAGIERMLRDPQFLAEAEKTQMEMNPTSVADVEALLTEFNSYSADVVDGARKAMGE